MWAVGKFAIALVIVTVISLGLVFGLMMFFQAQRRDQRTPTTIEPTKLFPQPQLQQTPVLDLRAIRAEEDKVLDSYAWVDQPKGVVRIPDRAGHGHSGQTRAARTPRRRPREGGAQKA